MESADSAVVNNDFLKDAGLKPADALAQDDPRPTLGYQELREPPSLLRRTRLATRTYKKLLKSSTKSVMDVVREETRGTAVEVNVSTDELRRSLANEEAKLRARSNLLNTRLL